VTHQGQLIASPLRKEEPSLAVAHVAATTMTRERPSLAVAYMAATTTKKEVTTHASTTVLSEILRGDSASVRCHFCGDEVAPYARRGFLRRTRRGRRRGARLRRWRQ
jgi:hypothetical protein